MPSLAQAIERLYDLNVGTTPVAEGSPHEKPHKPLLLLAAFDLLDEGLATPDRIPWCQALRDRFKARFDLVRKHNDQCNPDLPFRYLGGDGFWQPLFQEAGGVRPLDRTPLVGDFGRAFARFTDGFDVLAALPGNRRQMREALVARYFPHHAAALLGASPSTDQKSTINNPQSGSPPSFSSHPPSSISHPPSPSALREDEPEYGRSPAFRRKILEIYDHQCAACGLRIRLPLSHDVSFIDAAHLIPFAESRNDHPTNGLALCKNHHWAMDRNLIAPCADHRWHVSRVLDARRSNGERELLDLAGKPLLLPRDEAFHPAEEFLKWRCERLIA